TRTLANWLKRASLGMTQLKLPRPLAPSGTLSAISESNAPFFRSSSLTVLPGFPPYCHSIGWGPPGQFSPPLGLVRIIESGPCITTVRGRTCVSPSTLMLTLTTCGPGVVTPEVVRTGTPNPPGTDISIGTSQVTPGSDVSQVTLAVKKSLVAKFTFAST